MTESIAPTAPRAGRGTFVGLFLVAMSTLMLEILLTRIFSVTMLYHFAFAAVSLAMFGMTVGALIVYLRPDTFPASRAPRQLALASAAFAVATVFAFLTHASIPFRIHPSIVGIYAVAFTFTVIAVPFVFSGIAVTLALTRFPSQVSYLYGADLIGAALGCPLVILTLNVTDGPTAVIAVAALAAAAGWAFATGTTSRRVRWLAAACTITLAFGAAGHTVLVWREFPVLRLLYVKGEFESRPLFERWNSYSRVRITGDENALERPFAWGLSAKWPDDRLVRQLRLDIDVAAGTVLTHYTGQPSETDHLRMDVTNMGYAIRPHADVLVVGTGGGRDILSALTFDARSVTGVELNPNIIRTVNGRFGAFTGHLDRDPRVTFVNDEARSYIARQQRQFDLIQISLIDTWAATASGAFVLSENSLYTVEAWDLFLRRLTDHGLLSVSRWYFKDRPAEVYRIAALAVSALARRGIADPRSHIAIIRNVAISGKPDTPDGVGTLLVSPSPLSDADLDRIDAVSRDLGFDVVLSPRVAADDMFARIASGRDLEQLAASFPLNIAPPTDDSPFFFQMLRLRQIGHWELWNQGKQTHNLRAVLVLGTLLATVLVLTALCIIVPLVLTSREIALARQWPLLTYFAAIGLGFMLIETSQMQRLIVFLGHPTYGLSVVLFALLLASGIGSLLTGRVRPDRVLTAGLRRLGVLVAVLVAFGLLTPPLVRVLAYQTTPVRILAAIALLFPAGLMMGMAFPLGMKLAVTRGPERLAPWLWGINGAASVLAGVLAVAIALTWTISTAFWVGTLTYVVALSVFALGARRQEA
jgi:hypothetical protein